MLTQLSGFPEDILAKRFPLGKVVFDRLYFILVEAKQDHFETAWAQFLAKMITAQRLNGENKVIVFVIVYNGATWQFYKLAFDKFTRNINPCTIYEVDYLL